MRNLVGAVVVLGLHSSCTKTETVYVAEPRFCFEIKPNFDEFVYTGMKKNSAKAGLPVEFNLCQPANFPYIYSWDLGDGTTSAEPYPQHTYTKRGSYTVSLFVKKGEHSIDTIRQTLQVYAGDQYFAPDAALPAFGVDLVETSDKGILIIGYRPTSANDVRRRYFVLKLDAALQQQWVRELPSGMVNLSSIQPITADRYILTGHSDGISEQYGLTCINEQGTVLWSKAYDLGRGLISYAAGTADGNIIAIGQKPILQGADTVGLRNTIITTTADGSLLSEKGFDDIGPLWGAENFLVENDAVVFAGNKPGVQCGGKCDSVFITKILITSGLPLWSRAMQWYNSRALGNTRIVRTGATYQVSTRYESVLFNFTGDGQFLDRQQLYTDSYGPGYQVATSDNLSLLLLSNKSSQTSGSVVKLATASERKWQQSFAYPVSARSLSDGQLILLGHGNEGRFQNNKPVKLVVRKIGVQGDIY
ncbi:PKD domain-containing protein [Paraflavitalea pollutisoli]|uniref:PKD domain-containing protein n=1 Tax=Paraflavitalea pollutisoli TaxID=3034143 RepID=UPI0023EBDF29|nr:PKD domain-containing protein [Paraflavitalea sp. H1-2-19X]